MAPASMAPRQHGPAVPLKFTIDNLGAAGILPAPSSTSTDAQLRARQVLQQTYVSATSPDHHPLAWRQHLTRFANHRERQASSRQTRKRACLTLNTRGRQTQPETNQQLGPCGSFSRFRPHL